MCLVPDTEHYGLIVNCPGEFWTVGMPTFQLAKHPKSAPSHGGIYTPYMFTGLTWLSILNCISVGSAVFAQLAADSSCTLQCVLKCD